MTKGTCSIETCERPHKAKGFCSPHYNRWRSSGDPCGGPRPLEAVRSTCSVDGCVLPARSRTAEWCEKHYLRWYRHGDPEISLLGHGFVDFHGYRVVSAPNHPLARKRGDVLEHRKVLFDAIGTGEHPCHWCGTEVTWSESYPASLRGLVVDHLDGDRLNNARSNLVPSCAPCNGGRR